MAGGKRNVKCSRMAITSEGSYQVHTEARGPHWIGWISRDGSGKPDRGVILVAPTQQEAEARVRSWVEQAQDRSR
jgi:hypothetical protein